MITVLSFSTDFFSCVMKIKLKRIYDKASKEDGLRILVDRLWPRGVAKTDALVDIWLKGIAPSNELRKWFNHDPEKWDEFKSRYFSELHKNSELVADLIESAKKGPITLIFSTKETRFNNATALKEYLERKL